MSEIRFEIEETGTGLYRATSPDDAGIHVVSDTKANALHIARLMKRDLDEARMH